MKLRFEGKQNQRLNITKRIVIKLDSETLGIGENGYVRSRTIESEIDREGKEEQ